MKRGFTLVELAVVIAIIGIIVAVVGGAIIEQRERARCKRGHEEPTGATVCTKVDSQTQRCEPEKRFVCDEYIAEEGGK